VEGRGRGVLQSGPAFSLFKDEQAQWNCDDHDQPALAASFPTVSTPGRETTVGSDQPVVLPIIDAGTGSEKPASTTGHHEHPSISDCAEPSVSNAPELV
jgi:hypothetical protein